MITTMNKLMEEAKEAVLGHAADLTVVRSIDELVVNMVANEENLVLCVVSRKDTDKHLWLVYLDDHSSYVTYYQKQDDYYEEEMGG